MQLKRGCYTAGGKNILREDHAVSAPRLAYLHTNRYSDAALTLTITIKLSGKRQQSNGKHPQNIVRGDFDD
jgi:hypothetical protein